MYPSPDQKVEHWKEKELWIALGTLDLPVPKKNLHPQSNNTPSAPVSQPDFHCVHFLPFLYNYTTYLCIPMQYSSVLPAFKLYINGIILCIFLCILLFCVCLILPLWIFIHIVEHNHTVEHSLLIFVVWIYHNLTILCLINIWEVSSVGCWGTKLLWIFLYSDPDIYNSAFLYNT